jgi:hypothetical protein
MEHVLQNFVQCPQLAKGQAFFGDQISIEPNVFLPLDWFGLRCLDFGLENYSHNSYLQEF